MKKLTALIISALTLFACKTYAQQVALASDGVKLVVEPGTKIVTEGGISFRDNSILKNNGEIHMYKTTAVSPEGWLDSTTAGVMDMASTGNVFFHGTNRQSFFGLTKFYDLTMRNTVGDTLLSSCEVMHNLNLDTGYIYTKSGYGSDSLLVSNTEIAAITSTSNFSKSWVNGRLSRKGDVPGSVATFYLFPIGKTDSLYAPIRLEKENAAPITWTAEYWYEPPFDRTNIMGLLDHISAVENWEISSNNQSSVDDNARLSLSWRGQSFVSANPSVRDSLVIAQYIPNPGLVWDMPPGNWITGNTSGADSLFGYVRSIAPTYNYSQIERRFTLGTINHFNPLPIKLIYFTAIADGNKVRLNWDVANEQDTRTYVIERSLNTVNFSPIGSVLSRQQTQSAYIDFDYNPATGWNYYRLKIIDKSGSFTYSPVRPVLFEKGRENVKLFPVPTSTVLNIQLPTSYINQSTLQVIAVDGKFISAMTPAANMVVLNVQPLAAGSYFIQIIKADGSKQTYRFIKQ